jgi:hypothetical protein
MTIEQIWEYGKNRGSEFYSPYISDVDYIAKDHYIVHSGGIVYVDGINSNYPAGLVSGKTTLVSDTVELLDDEVIFELKLPTNNYRVEKMELYTGKEDVWFGLAKRKGSLGRTSIDKFSVGTLGESYEVDEDYNSHNITISKEVDRLVFKGTFKRMTDVNIILYKNMTMKTYNVPVSKKPYTALCVDVFTEEENENGIGVTKYINEDGLNGKYSIYVSIDGIIYNTGEYVEF